MPDWIILAGALITLSLNTLALVMGIARFKTWFQGSVVEPYIKPLKDDVASMKASQSEDHKMLLEHDKYIYLLLGKQLGGIPHLDGEKP